MVRPRFIPVLLLKGRGLYKTVKFKNPTYVGDPINAVRIFNEKAVDEIILLDIAANRHERGPDLDAVSDIVSEAFIPICYGGGVSGLSHCEALFRAGVEKVSVNSAATGAMQLVAQAARAFGSQSVVVGIDARRSLLGRYDRYINSGRSSDRTTAVEVARRAVESGCGEVLLQSIDRDGTMQGYDLKLVAEVSSAVQVPVIACGGASGIDDMARAIRHGAASAAAGSIFVFQGPHRAVLITYPDRATVTAAIEDAKGNEILAGPENNQ